MFNNTNSTWILVVVAALLGSPNTASAQSPQELNRTVLPIAEPEPPTYEELDVRNTQPPPRFEVKAPDKAPNVLIILIDDLGFGATSTFGGPIPTPTLEQLAQGGLRYNNFHTTALCSPTRVALKSGRNHHTANAGSIMETSTAYPGNTGRIPNRVAPLAEMMRLNGYSTGAFGKWHETAAWETSISGPFDRWPTRQGFDKFYGFIGGETDQWSPLIFDGVKRINPPRREGYHFTEDMTDQAINWMKAQQSMTPDKPFFMYFATGATHAPHHVPKEWIAKFEGEFDNGWDMVRQASYERQKQSGIIPANTQLAPRPDDIVPWDTLSDDEKKLFRRQAETFAGFVAHTDHHIGRLVDAIADIGEMDNTLIFYIAGDNGTSAEGGMVGMFNEMTYFNGVQEKVEDLVLLIDQWGSPDTFPHMSAGWAVAFDAPFTWTKQVASDFGGTRNGMVVHWPDGIEQGGGLRSQFSHVIDVAPTVLEAATLPEPGEVNGTSQIPMEGTSMLYTFNNADAEDRHTVQYFEIFGNRAIYSDGWFARTIHRAPWQTGKQTPLEDDVWDLYQVEEDFSLTNNLAGEHPEKLEELKRLFMTEAAKYRVLPIDDRTIARANPAVAGRPDLIGDRTSLTLYEGMDGMLENTFINVKNRSKTITAEIEIPEEGASGALLVQGSRYGGWSLHLRDGRPAYEYNWLGLERFVVESPAPLAPGPATVVLNFDYDGNGSGKGGNASLLVNGEKVAEGRIGRTQPNVFSADETADVGLDNQTPVAQGIGYGPEETRFAGKIHQIVVEVR
ncbi:sulfatase-like hydrolase/transferase [Marinobacter sp. LN3S78]|uniref:sulfatase-like hydrolase/transferase n=1 Tax=Marinobacter sp. LN3S78 TaxID=3382300 RepID=UPI00387B7D97